MEIIMKKERLVGPDILRTLAIVLVMLTHLINYNSAYFLHTDLRTPTWTVTVFIRFTVILCVPIFLLLTGYFLSTRKPDRKHFTSIISVMVSWFILSVITNIAEWHFFAPTAISIPRAILNIFSFSYGYTWYVEMYLCLFLVIPYINIALDNMSRRAQLTLTLIVGALTFLPAFGKSFIVTGIWFNGFPEQFEGIYCVGYYLIGAYIARHKPKPSPVLCALVFLGTVGLETALSYYYSDPEYAWWLFTQYSAVTHAIAATALFLLLYRVEKLPRPIGAVVKEISVCSFEMYLISYFTDKVFYYWGSMTVKIPGLEWLTSHALVITWACNMVCAYLLARIFRVIVTPLSNGLRSLMLGKGKKAKPTDI